MRFNRSRASARMVLGGVALSIAGLSTTSLSATSVLPAPAESVAVARVDGAATRHVVVISVDGLRPDAIGVFGAKTMQRLMREGSHTLQARTIMPSRTLPSHTSMLTGEEPENHGITWNSDQTDTHGVVEVPTIFGRARRFGFQTAAFFSKSKFHHLEVPNTLDHCESPDGGEKWSASETADKVERFLTTQRPNLLFVHLGDPDYAGHKFSWMSWFYGRAVRRADRAIAQILAAADRAYGKGQYAVIVTADHGGHGWDHGSSDPRDVTIPWMAWGQGVRSGTILPAGVRTMDTAATALRLLGLPALGVGEPVWLAFEPVIVEGGLLAQRTVEPVAVLTTP